jgi:hypothetical protein
MIVWNTLNYWGFGLCSSSSIIKSRKHNFGFVWEPHTLRCMLSSTTRWHGCGKLCYHPSLASWSVLRNWLLTLQSTNHYCGSCTFLTHLWSGFVTQSGNRISSATSIVLRPSVKFTMETDSVIPFLVIRKQFFLIPFYLQAVQIHLANVVKLLQAWRGVLSSTPQYK